LQCVRVHFSGKESRTRTCRAWEKWRTQGRRPLALVRRVGEAKAMTILVQELSYASADSA
jgi:hypothetical protein